MEFKLNNILTANYNLNQLSQRTGYNITQSNGQRIYSSPNHVNPPPKGCEVFFGKIPRDIFEDELVPIFQRLDNIYQMRLMMDYNGLNRGYGFVTYFKPAIAKAAVSLLNGYEVRPGKKMGVFSSIDNCRLYIGGIPPEKTKEEVYQTLTQYMEGIKDIIMYYTYGNRNLNRGFVFVEFYEHCMASIARKNLHPGSLLLWGVSLFVEWADPIPEVDAAIQSKIKNLYLSNLDIDISNDSLWNTITQVVPPIDIIKIHKNFNYAFIHFSSRKSAENAIKAMKGLFINGEAVEITWARPKWYSKAIRNKNPPNHFCKSLSPSARKEILSRRKNIKSIADNSRRVCPISYSSSTSTLVVKNKANTILPVVPPCNPQPYLRNVNNINMNPAAFPNFLMHQQLRFPHPDPYPMNVTGFNDWIYTRLF